LEALREAPYAFGSTLEEWQDASEERWRRRLTEVPFNVVAYVDDRAAGIAGGFAEQPGTAKLISMWVAPFARGGTVGDALIQAVIGWSRQNRCTRLVLDVAVGNDRAVAFYRRNGFVVVDLVHDADGRHEHAMMLTL
jgi:ribosomal protein S18 acetylase RimI-like enzyme